MSTAQPETTRIPFHLSTSPQSTNDQQPPTTNQPLSTNNHSPSPGIARTFAAIALMANEPNGWVISPDVLRISIDANLWNGCAINIDHPGIFDAPSVRDLIGAFRNPRFDTTADTARVIGDLCLFDLAQAKDTIELLDLILQQRAANLPTPPIGLSAVLSMRWDWENEKRVVREIKKVWSLDVVFEPASAGATVTKVLNSNNPNHSINQTNTMPEQNPIPLNTTTPPVGAGLAPAPEPMSATPIAPTTPPAAPSSTDLAHALLQAQCDQLLATRLASSNFPPPVQALIRAKFTAPDGNTTIFHPDELNREIDSARAIAAAVNGGDAIQGMGNPRSMRVSAMFDSRDKIEAAYDRLMGLQIGAPALRDVPRLSGIRELYTMLTGDRDMRGMFDPALAQFAVTASTFADATANVQNKVLMAQTMRMARLGYMWWKRVVNIANFNTLQDARFVRLGGVGNLPTVAEGAAYTELSWDDAGQAVPFVKKGGYLGLTLEMIDKDDVGAWRSVGEALATAAIRTISASVAAIFTAPPTITETGQPLFAAAHNNTGITPLSPAAWDSVVQAMFKQTELNSAKRLGVRPDRILVPIELRKSALALFYSNQEPGGVLNDINIAQVPGDKDSDGPVIVVPEFTDANDWFALAAPEIAPVIGCGFRFGEQPEIISAADPTSYYTFTADILPIKARWFYAIGAIDFRGVYRMVVP